jgi:DNA-binding response OmpR family regulator
MLTNKPVKKILIAEDEQSLQKILVRRIGGLGHEILTASDGEEALEVIKNRNPDLILLDIILPIKNGFDVLQELRLKLRKQTPVIIISNLEGEQDVASAKNLGVSAYITKANITLRDLSKIVNQVLGELDKTDQKPKVPIIT